MLYKEGTLPAKELSKASHHSEPYNAPTHAGGLFAIDRAWFEELGWYDPGLWVWGGENFELSFKVERKKCTKKCKENIPHFEGLDVWRSEFVGSLLQGVSRLPRPLLQLLSQRKSRQQVWRTANHSEKL